MKTLHQFNPVRLAFIRDAVGRSSRRATRGPAAPLEGLTLLDVGCGGGLLCEPLARLGADVTGIDPAPTNVEVARLHAEQSGVPVTYRQAAVEELVAEGQTLRHRARHGGRRARGRRRAVRGQPAARR